MKSKKIPVDFVISFQHADWRFGAAGGFGSDEICIVHGWP
jgi:hypothetical protein